MRFKNTGKRGSMAIAVLLGISPGWGADWVTFGGDPQRTGWVKREALFNRESVKKLKLVWSRKLESPPTELDSLTAPVIAERVVAPGGFKDIVIIGGSDDHLYAIDADTGKLLWDKKFDRQGEPLNHGTGGWLCPNAMNATPVLDRNSRTVHVISSDGRLHSINYVNGEYRRPAVQFVPPFSKNWSLNLVDGVLYTSTSQGCNRSENGVWAMDLKNPEQPVAHWRAVGGMWGRAGIATGLDGRIYGELGDGATDTAAGRFSNAVVALKPHTLELEDYYIPVNSRWIDRKDLDMGNMSPILFRFKEWELVAASGKEGVIYLLDTKSLGGADHTTPLFRSPLYTNEDVDFAGRGFWGAMSTWQDSKEVRWLLAPAWGGQHSQSPKFPVTHGDTPDGSVMAFRVDVKDAKPVLEPMWRSINMKMPEPVIIAGGVVFAVESGENVHQVDSGGSLITSKTRAETSTHAVLYALDAATGEQLFSSGDAIKSFTHFSGLSISENRLYVVTYDGSVYAFGLPEE
jgi:hypothetical protein